ncbi:MAG: amidohydrolase [Sphingobacteriales bacterium]|nr:MAG: amidohydrolase [Sphingobacteriales bacterium]
MKKSLLSIVLTIYASQLLGKQKIDLLVTGITVYTVAEEGEISNTIAIEKGRVIGIGTDIELNKNYEARRNINAKGYIFPGFIDAHCHFSGYALDMYKCDLVGTASFVEVIEKVVAYDRTNKLSWIYARGWDQNDWTVKEFPDKSVLDSLFPDKPVILKRVDGHAILANQRALDMAGITMQSDFKGGSVEKKNGNLTGILIDNAMEPVENIVPPLPEQEATSYMNKMEQECYSLGLTGVVDCGVEGDIIRLLEKLYAGNKLTISNTTLLSQSKPTLEQYMKNGPLTKNNLTVSAIKIYADGALGSRGACLLKDYSDKHGHRGTMLSGLDEMSAIADDALKYKWQVCTHAIGDSANRTILKLYASKLKTKNDLRWRVEHAQVVHPSDYHFFSDYSIIPSVQPTHAISDMPWAEERLGTDRVNNAYAYKQLLNQNGWLPLGTDFPVEGINPIATFYTAAIRKDKNGKPEEGFLKANGLTREEALKGMTIWAAKSVGNENKKGSIEIGKDADIVILDQDIMTVDESKILSTRVLYTISKGEIKYQAK